MSRSVIQSQSVGRTGASQLLIDYFVTLIAGDSDTPQVSPAFSDVRLKP